MTAHSETCNAYGLPRQRLAYCTCGAQPHMAPPTCHCTAIARKRAEDRARLLEFIASTRPNPTEETT